MGSDIAAPCGSTAISSSGGLLGFRPRTGADVLRWALVGVDLLVVGVVALVLARYARRRGWTWRLRRAST